MKAKPHKCRCGCGELFTPRNGWHVASTPDCAIRIASAKRAKDLAAEIKAERKIDRAKREKMKTRSDWMKEAQTAVNAYVRARDFGLPCISCGRYHQGQYHAGHYLSRGAHPELALEPLNIHKQCAPCNTHLSGNQIKFRAGLIQRHGVEIVEWLEGQHTMKKYTVADLKSIKADYQERMRNMKKDEQ